MADTDDAQDVANAENSVTALVNASLGPRRVQGDAGMVEQYSLKELIAVSQYLASIAAGKLRNRGLRFNKLVPPGTVERCAGELGGGTGNNDSWGITGGFPS